MSAYLRHERPATPSPAIFVRRRDSRDIPITTDAVQKVIRRACRRVGLPDSGSHVLRHTLACRLVESGGSLKEVADVLRHRSLEPYRAWIEEQVRLKRNAKAIYQDLVDRFGFSARYNSVKRFVRSLRRVQPSSLTVWSSCPARRRRSTTEKARPRAMRTPGAIVGRGCS